MRLFKVFFPTRVVVLLLSEIAIVFGCYLLPAYLTTENPKSFLFDDAGLYRIALVTFCIIIGFYLNDLYSQLRVRAKSQLLQQVCFVLGVSFLIQSILDYLKLSDWSLPKWPMIFGSLLVLLIEPAWRILYSHLVIRRLAHETVLFVGASSVARMVGDRLTNNPHFGQSVVGYLEDLPPSGAVPADLLLGPIDRLCEIVESLKPQRIIVGMTAHGACLPVHQLLEMRSSGIYIEEAQTAYENVFGRVSVKELRRTQLIFMTDLRPHPKGQFLQRLYSFGLALVGFLVASPLMLLIALVVKFTSPGPVLYRQIKAGKHGVNFTLFRFRSMFHRDSRVTPVGRWLRRLRLDDLPQLINVLRGEMIVGPRPERPEFVDALAGEIPYYHQRLAVKPGITGWAQVNRRSSDAYEDTLLKLEYDLYYIKNLSMTLDLYILFQTAKTMLLSGGAP